MRTLTDERKEQMRVARVRAAERRRDEQAGQVVAYRAWIDREARAFARLQLARIDGDRTTIDRAYDDWSFLLRSMPPFPPDSAWKRERGEEVVDDDPAR